MTKPLGQRTNSFDQVDSWQLLNVKFNNNNNNKEHPTSHEASWLLGKCNPNLKHGWSWLITCKWNSHKWPVILSHLFSLLWFHWSLLNHHGYLLDYQRWQHFELPQWVSKTPCFQNPLNLATAMSPKYPHFLFSIIIVISLCFCQFGDLRIWCILIGFSMKLLISLSKVIYHNPCLLSFFFLFLINKRSLYWLSYSMRKEHKPVKK